MKPLYYIFAVVLAVQGDCSTDQVPNNSVPSNCGSCSSQYSDTAAQIIQGLYSSVVKADCELASPSDYPPCYKPNDGEEFDFIVVGAGSAGSVVANRLTEVSGWKVLLLEAGTNPTKTSEVPLLASALQKTDEDWQYQTEPGDNYCLGMQNNRCNWPRGRVLGGSSTLNFMMYVRGNAKDYARWESEGCTDWGYEKVLPYFKKSEKMTAEEVINQPDFTTYHGTDGYLTVESWQKSPVKPIGEAFSKGMSEIGYAPNPDCNGKTQSGFVTMQGTLRDGRRCSTAKGFLTPITKRNNLKVYKNAQASKVMIDKKTKKAYGVQFYNKNGKLVTVRAKKEVVVSAGVLNTPQLLILSGIGPKKLLSDLSIEVIQDLPVGKNLQDHMMMIGFVITHNISLPAVPSDEIMLNFLLKRENIFSGIGAATYGGFIYSVKDVSHPDIQILLLNFGKGDSGGLSGFLAIHGVKDEVIQKYVEVNAKSSLIILLTTLLRPKSRGEVYLSSIDPKQKPKITAGYFSDDTDLNTFVKTYDFVTQLVQTQGLLGIGAQFIELQLPGCSSYTLGTTEYRKCYLRHLTSTNYHHCCTCKMGQADSPDTVVDPYLRVKGIDGLMVIDASVMPDLPSGNINAPVIMIAEKASDIIKKKWLNSS